MEKLNLINWTWLFGVCYAIVYISYYVYLLKKNKITESNLSFLYTLRKMWLILIFICFIISTILFFFYPSKNMNFGEWMVYIINNLGFIICLFLANEVVLLLQKRHLKNK
jgi:hypothetical protein